VGVPTNVLKYTVALAIYATFLSTCSLVTQSPFATWIGLVQRQAEISDKIEYDAMGQYRVHVVDDGTSEYVFVVAAIPGKEKSVAVYDTELNSVFALTEPFSSSLFHGDSRPVADENGNVYLGLLAFGPGMSRRTDLASTNVGTLAHVTDGTSPSFVVYSLNGSSLTYWPVPLNPSGVPGSPTNKPLDTSGANYQQPLTATSHISDTVAFIAHDEANSSIGGFFSTPSTFVNTNLLTAEVITSPGGFKFSIDMYPDEIWVAEDAIIVRENRPDSAVLIAYDVTGAQLGTLNLNISRERFAMSMANSHFYVFDPENTMLRRLSTWW